jgi:DNA-binding MarR family transcriptional regulator
MNKRLMLDSRSLRLVYATGHVHDALTRHVSRMLIERGWAFATPSRLRFLSELECGVNYASEIARRLDLSRQVVAKTVAEMSRLGVLQVEQDQQRGNQNLIRFTERGERLMADAREVLAALDATLGDEEGLDRLLAMLTELQLRLADEG